MPSLKQWVKGSGIVAAVAWIATKTNKQTNKKQKNQEDMAALELNPVKSASKGQALSMAKLPRLLNPTCVLTSPSLS